MLSLLYDLPSVALVHYRQNLLYAFLESLPHLPLRLPNRVGHAFLHSLEVLLFLLELLGLSLIHSVQTLDLFF